MAREIKFRAWHVNNNKMVYGVTVRDSYAEWKDENGKWWLFESGIMQFTGLKDKNGKEIYEGDIFRVEEDAEDLIYYLVIVWVQEWCMFCTLRVADEYFGYQTGGIKALDEPMFWTYTLEDTNDRRFFLCGNVHENPELLK